MKQKVLGVGICFEGYGFFDILCVQDMSKKVGTHAQKLIDGKTGKRSMTELRRL